MTSRFVNKEPLYVQHRLFYARVCVYMLCVCVSFCCRRNWKLGRMNGHMFVRCWFRNPLPRSADFPRCALLSIYLSPCITRSPNNNNFLPNGKKCNESANYCKAQVAKQCRSRFSKLSATDSEIFVDVSGESSKSRLSALQYNSGIND